MPSRVIVFNGAGKSAEIEVKTTTTTTTKQTTPSTFLFFIRMLFPVIGAAFGRQAI